MLFYKLSRSRSRRVNLCHYIFFIKSWRSLFVMSFLHHLRRELSLSATQPHQAIADMSIQHSVCIVNVHVSDTYPIRVINRGRERRDPGRSGRSGHQPREKRVAERRLKMRPRSPQTRVTGCTLGGAVYPLLLFFSPAVFLLLFCRCGCFADAAEKKGSGGEERQ